MGVRRGFSLVELLITIGIFSSLIGFATLNFYKAKHSSSFSSALSVLVADLQEQQVKAMVGDTEGRGVADNYGIHFQTTSYTIFHGTTYSLSDTSNFTVTLPDTIEVASTTFTSSQVIYTKGSGEVSGFVNGSNTVTLRDTNEGSQKTITINRYGVITGIN